MKEILTMFQYIFICLLWHLLCGSIVTNGEAKVYSLKENHFDSKTVNSLRHLVDVSPQMNSGNAGKIAFSSPIDLEGNSKMTSPFKGNDFPIDLGSHNTMKIQSSANRFKDSKPLQNFAKDSSSDESLFNDDNGDNKEYDDRGDRSGSGEDADVDNTTGSKNKRALRRKVKKGKGGRILPQLQTDKCECGIYNAKEVQNRIINGVETAKNQYPWMVSIKYTGYNHFCGGSIISDQFILTAAHCTFGMKPDELQVTIGDHDLTKKDVSRAQTLHVKQIFNYPEYDEFTTNNDLALLKLKKAITFTWRVNPICLTPQDLTYYKETVTVMGWGLLNENHKQGSPVLKHVQVKVLPMQKCRNDFKYKSEDITSKMICAFEKGQDACQGDSGGPLVWRDQREDRYFQIGATSWGIGCASEYHPGVYTKLTKFIEWIYDTAKESTFCQTYIPKGAKMKNKMTKARLDKEATENMKGTNDGEENMQNEVHGNEDINLVEEDTTTENNNVILENNIDLINNTKNISNDQLVNNTDSFLNNKNKSNDEEDIKEKYEQETNEYEEVKDDSNDNSHSKNRGMEKRKGNVNLSKSKNKASNKVKTPENNKKKGKSNIHSNDSIKVNRNDGRKSENNRKSSIVNTKNRGKLTKKYQKRLDKNKVTGRNFDKNEKKVNVAKPSKKRIEKIKYTPKSKLRNYKPLFKNKKYTSTKRKKKN